ncbi:uncharacterized protein LOC109825649 [Asparagus officinalis]|uniref:uncharacterized protein LOC109825649 n=1 Tax=Asparagus officinalis TaxID=4686 RepID=UPI00098E0ED4|nr:uncharacterized protein LOC109825649 [Asparagus officinalis]
MCGDVGFPDKLFQCIRCISRFQHSYCSNYYQEEPSGTADGICDWCLSEDRRPSSKKNSGYPSADHKGKRGSDQRESAARGKSSGGSSSSAKPSGRRYKLLKDVLC